MRQSIVVRLRRNSEGAALIEFAFALPLLLLILLGILDFGRFFRDYHVVMNAAREGARMAVLPGYTTTDVENRVSQFLNAGEVTLVSTSVDPGSFNPGGGVMPMATRIVTVHASYTFGIVGPISQLFGGTFGTVPISATSEMRTQVAGGL